MTVFLTENKIVSFYPLTSSKMRSAHFLPERCALLDREVRTSRFRARNEGFFGVFWSCQHLTFFDHKNIDVFRSF